MLRSKWHYAWIILLVSFFGLLAAQGIRLSFGAFIVPWQEQFHTDRGTISLVSALSFIVYGLTVPFFGKLTDKYGVYLVFSLSALLTGLSTIATAFATETWHLFFLYGVVSSIGFGGASGVVATVAVTSWFTAKRGLAYGILEAGFGAGQMVIAPASLLLIHAYGWQTATTIIGGFLVCVVFPLLLLFLKSNPADKGMKPYGGETTGEGSISHPDPEPAAEAPHARNLYTMPLFWMLLLPFAICGFTTTGLMDTHLIPFSHGAGHSTEVTGAAVSLLAAFNIAGCLLSGKLADHWSPAKILGVLYVVRAASMIFLLYAAEPYLLFLFAIVFGLVDFATVAPTTLLTARYFQRYSLGFVLGLLTLSHQIGSAAGSYIPGWLYTQTGDYTISFVFSVILLLLASALSFALRSRSALE